MFLPQVVENCPFFFFGLLMVFPFFPVWFRFLLDAGHHGSNAASSLDFLKMVKPKVAVVQAGAGNQYGHPTKPVLDRLRQVKARIYRTDRDGTVVVLSDGQSYTVEEEK